MTRLRFALAMLLVTAACGGKSAPATVTGDQPVTGDPPMPRVANDVPLTCTLGELTVCCAHPVDMRTTCPEEGAPINGPKASADPCKLTCDPGEIVVELAPNADERRFGCVACPQD